MDWQEEAGAAGDPTSIGRKAAAWDDAMDVRVMGQGLAPTVQDRDHAGLGAEMFGIGTDGADCLGRGLEEDIVNDGFVLQGDRCERGRHGEDEMEIWDWQQFGAAVGQPLGAREPLALGAVPIAEGIVGDADLAAVLTLLDVSAKHGGAARLDGGHHAALALREPAALRCAERIAVAAENVRHLQNGAHARRSLRRRYRETQAVEGASGRRDQIGGDLRIARRRRQIRVPAEMASPTPALSLGSAHDVILALDLGTTTGFAIAGMDGGITSGTAEFRLDRWQSGGMRFLRFKRWLTELKHQAGGSTSSCTSKFAITRELIRDTRMVVGWRY